MDLNYGAKKTTVYCPTSIAITDHFQKFAPRIDTFNKKRVGLLWNGKPNGDFFLNRVATLLKEKYNEINLIKFWEIDPNRTAHPERKPDDVLDFIAKSADVVISAQGD
jgi:hypothetical protein